jgi:hypothetical protein
MPLAKLTKTEIEGALRRLSELAAAENVRLEMTIYGGALMLLAYDGRTVTKDVDAIVHPPDVARRLVAKVAAEKGWHDGWLNDDVKQFVSTKEQKNELTLQSVDRNGLHITRPTAKYLLAMKVMASRKPLPGYSGDYEDIERLLRITRISSVEEVQQIVETFFPDTVLPESVQVTIAALLAKTRNSTSAARAAQIHACIESRQTQPGAAEDGARRRAAR